MITRSQIKYEIWTRLNKTAATKGFYADAKVNSVVQESIDFVATEMFLADEGWNHKMVLMDTVTNQVAVPVPPDMAMIAEVRYLVGSCYIPLQYDQQFGEAQWGSTAGVVQFPSKWRLVDNNIYFNPALSIGGKGYLQVEYNSYPRRLQKDSDFLESQFDRSMFWWIVYHSCVVLTASVKMSTDWPAQESLWYNKMVAIIGMRNRQVIPIRDFDG